MKRITLSLLAIPVALCAQTTINGSRIIKGTLDASGASSSLPNRAGTGSPAGRDNCAKSGETYFQTDATPGQNLWACTAPGTPGAWNQNSGGGGGGASPTNISLNGVSQGAYGTLNLVNPTGLNWTLTPNGQTLSLAPTPDTTYLLSQTAAQTGSPFSCSPASGSGSAYTCNLVPAPSSLANGMLIEFRPDVSCIGGATTLNVNALGAKPIYSLDGASSPAANDCRAGRPTWLVYSTALNGGSGAFVLQSVANLPAQAPVSATVLFSATPTFAVTGTIQEFTITLTGNVTSSTMTGAVANDILVFNICQDANGNRTFTWPTGFSAAPVISSSASSCTRQIFVWDGSNANPVAPASSTNTPFLISGASERAAPATPPAGLASLWADSSRHTWTSTENNSANVHIMPRTAGAADQLASTDLSDTANVVRTNTGNAFTAGTQDFHAAAHTLPAVTGTTAAKPATCTVGEMYFATDATAGQNWYYCTAANTWTQQLSGGLSNPMTTAGDLIVGGTSGTPTRLAAPSNGTWCPNWSSGTVTWTNCASAGSANTENSFTNQTTLSISNPYGTQAVLIQFFDTSTPPQEIEPNTLQVASTSPYGITATFANQQSGYYVINGSAGGGGSPGGSIGQVQYYSSSGSLGGFTVSGDGTLNTSTGVLIVTQLEGGAIPANANVLATNSSRQLTGATYSNIVNLFTGCSGSQYLGADGNCHTATGGGGTATLASFDGGGAALNGTIIRCRNLKSALSPTQWTAIGDQSGSITVTAAYVPYATYQAQASAPAYVITSGTAILSGSVTTANSNQGTISGVTIPAGSVVCTQVSSESNFTWLSLEVAQ